MTQLHHPPDALQDTRPLVSLLGLILALALTLLALNIGVYLISQNLIGAAIALVAAITSLMLAVALQLARQGRRQAALTIFTLTLSLAAIAIVWIDPESLPITVLIPPLILITAIHHLKKSELGPLVIIACLVSLALVISGEAAQPFFGDAEPLAPAIRVISMVVMTLLFAATLWSFSSRLHATLARLEQTNHALSISEAQLYRSEQQFKTIAENAPDIIARYDRDFRYSYVNRAFQDATGMTVEAAIGKTHHELGVPEAVADQWLERFQAAVDGKSVQTLEFEMLMPQGARFYETRLMPELSPDGEVESLLAISRDVTERRQQNLALQQRQKIESLGVMAGGIAHEFNNLLGIILGNAELTLMNLPRDSTNRPLIDAIASAGRRATALMRQMLAYIGQSRLNTTVLDLNLLIEEMADLLQASIPRRVALTYRLHPELAPVEGDMTQLRQVLLNLTINAAEAIGELPGEIAISTDLRSFDRQLLTGAFLAPDLPAGNYVALQVTDNGCGIDADTLRRVFDPFFTTKFVGRGLGLPATFGIVRSHRGAIKIDSTPGQGTTVSIILPRLPAPGEQPATAETRYIPAHTFANLGIVLVVDDEEGVRAVATRMLEWIGYPVLAAGNAAEALRIAREHHNDLACVLLDMTMPQHNIQQTISELRRILDGLPIVLMSGYTEDIATRRFTELGLNGFLQKPFTSYELRDIITRTLTTA